VRSPETKSCDEFLFARSRPNGYVHGSARRPHIPQLAVVEVHALMQRRLRVIDRVVAAAIMDDEQLLRPLCCRRQPFRSPGSSRRLSARAGGVERQQRALGVIHISALAARFELSYELPLELD
jgi:hypothetical protein